MRIEDIKNGSFVKKEASIYLVKDFIKVGSRYRLIYFFRTTKKLTGVLHSNNFREVFEFELHKIHTPTYEEIEILKTKISKEFPNFPLEIGSKSKKQDIYNLTIENCIEFLREKGYIVLKQV